MNGNWKTKFGMTPLDRKLTRDLWRMKGQAIAISVVIALGVMLLIMMDGLVNSLEETKQAYYERYRLADIFCTSKKGTGSSVGRNCENSRGFFG